VENIAGIDELVFYDLPQQGLLRENGPLGFIPAIGFNRFLQRNGYDRVVFNTAATNFIRNLCFFSWNRKIPYLGVSHNTHKLIKGGSQKAISRRLRHYFVLSDYILQNPKLQATGLSISSVYTLFYPRYESVVLPDKADQIWIVIAGGIELKRRDYMGLLDTLANHQVDSRIRFILLGNSSAHDGKTIRDRVIQAGLQEQIILFDRFVDDPSFHAWLKACDFVMPLMHPSTPNFEKYLTCKISGAFNLAFGHGKPMLLDRAFEVIEDFRKTSLFYALDNLADVLNSLAGAGFMPDYSDVKWRFDHQAKSYLEFIEQ
jgi:hypothetical protein